MCRNQLFYLSTKLFCKAAELNFFFQSTIRSLLGLIILTKEFNLQVSENRVCLIAASVHLPTSQLDFICCFAVVFWVNTICV